MIMLTSKDNPLKTQDSRESYNEPYGAFAWALSDESVVKRFWSHVRRAAPNACWLWIASCTGRRNKHRPLNSRRGQFAFSFQKKQHHVAAHRFAYALVHGVISPEVHVLHTCDCPPCCNEQHLFPGDQDANMKDAAKKNRLTVSRERRLSLYERLTIYQTAEYRGVVVDLARQHHVTKACITHIRRGRFLGSGVWAGTKQGVLMLIYFVLASVLLTGLALTGWKS